MRSLEAMVMANAIVEPNVTWRGMTFEWVVSIVLTMTISPGSIVHGNLNATSVVVNKGTWLLQDEVGGLGEQRQSHGSI